MKRFSTFSAFVVLAALVSVIATVFIHDRSLMESRKNEARIRTLYENRDILSDMSMKLEKYRALSPKFRKMDPAASQTAKDELRRDFRDSITKIDPAFANQDITHKLEDQLSELISQSERFEKLLYSRDAYQKPEVQALHDAVVETLNTLSAGIEDRITNFSSDFQNSHSSQAIGMIGGAVLAMMLIFIGWIYVNILLPLSRLHKDATQLRNGGRAKPGAGVPILSGSFGDIQTTLHQLSDGIEAHVQERHKFILDVVADLKTPLALLQSGRALIGMAALGNGSSGGATTGATTVEGMDALDSMRRGLAMLSGSLDDFMDLVEIGRLDSKINEKTIDLSELIQEIARNLAGPGFASLIQTSVPPMPVWTRVDPVRLERVMIHSIAKVASTIRAGSPLLISVRALPSGSFRGIEVSIREAEKGKTGNAASGPELDLLKHWISEKGLNMALIHKIIRAQGGTISASGVAGGSVQITIRLPETKAASRGLITPPIGLEVQLPKSNAPEMAAGKIQ